MLQALVEVRLLYYRHQVLISADDVVGSVRMSFHLGWCSFDLPRQVSTLGSRRLVMARPPYFGQEDQEPSPFLGIAGLLCSALGV